MWMMCRYHNRILNKMRTFSFSLPPSSQPASLLSVMMRQTMLSFPIKRAQGIIAAKLDKRNSNFQKLSRALANKFVDAGKGCINSDNKKNVMKRKTWGDDDDKMVGRVVSRREHGRVTQQGHLPKFCHPLVLSEDEIRSGRASNVEN